MCFSNTRGPTNSTILTKANIYITVTQQSTDIRVLYPEFKCLENDTTKVYVICQDINSHYLHDCQL